MIDSHCHLDRLAPDDNFADLDEQIRYTQKSGVECLLNVSVDLTGWQNLVAICHRHDNVYASVGVHPNSKCQSEPTGQDLLNRADDKKVIAIGETGLDYHYIDVPKEVQKARFRTHIQAALSAELPLIIHSREAPEDTIKILTEERAKCGVMHCFTESWEMAQQALALGFYISFSGIITFKNAEQIRQVARQTPLDRLLIETDSPYLAPTPYRGKPNQPLYLKYVAEKLAEVRGMTVEEVVGVTTDNFRRLFGKHC